MLTVKTRKPLLLLLAGLVVAMALAAPSAQAKKTKVGGSVTITVPGFDPNTNSSLANGFVRAKKGCAKLRVLRFAYFNPDGTPAPNTPQATVVSTANGSYFAALIKPTTDGMPFKSYIVKVVVDGKKVKRNGKKVNCLPITGPDTPIVVAN